MTNVKIERVSNGFIIEKDKKKQVVTSLDEYMAQLKEELSRKFSNDRPIYEFNYEIKQPNG